MMCKKCAEIPFGTYENKLEVIAPFSEKSFYIDACMAAEINFLWKNGIKTIECCCGHNKAESYIMVDKDSIHKMKELGYQNQLTKPERKDLFRSKDDDFSEILTTEKREMYFNKCCTEAITFFGLYSFQFNIESQHKPSARASNYYWSLENNPESDGRIFTICYSYDWIDNKNTTKQDIRKTAFHEIFESMFYRLRDFSTNTKYIVTEREVDSEIHNIIRTFENKLLPLIEEKEQ